MADARFSWLPPATSVSVTAWPGAAEALAARVAAALGLVLAPAGRFTEAGDLTCVWLAPGHWQIEHPDRPDLVDTLAEAVGEAGGVIDVSDGWAALRLAGPDGRAVLARVLPLDLHPRAFGPGHAASTHAAHLTVRVRQIDAAPTYDLACLCGYRDSLARALLHAGAAA